MFRRLATLACLTCLLLVSLTAHAQDKPRVTLHTSAGDIVMELYPDKAPVTVDNFLRYARGGFYEGTIFHRVIRRFVIQTGGFNKEMMEKDTREPIVNEADNGLRNDRWTVAMARTNEPDSATSQFFINVGLNLSLDRRAGRAGYAVFGKVIEGRDVVRAISNLPTRTLGHMRDVPVEPPVIEKVSVQPAAADKS